MKNNFVRFFSVAFIWLAVLSCSAEGDAATADSNKEPAVVEKQELVPFSEVAVDTELFTLAKSMKTGWNLGNSFDATSNIDNFSSQNAGLASLESWGVPRARKETMETLAQAGFKTVRIPVSWSNHIIDKEYTIDPEWMAKVKECVDWAIGCNLFVSSTSIMTMHLLNLASSMAVDIILRINATMSH